jgi:hypothetical protein
LTQALNHRLNFEEPNNVLWQTNELVLLLAVLAGFLAITELGFRLAKRRGHRGDEGAKDHLNNLQGAVLGLLALLLGFTLYMAASRYDDRRTLELEEANAIGTTYLRSQMLSPEDRKAAKTLLRAHVDARLAFYAAGIDAARIEKANNDAARTESALWAIALEASARDSGSVPVGLFVESLNEMIDLHEKRQVAFENHVPGPVLYLPLVVAAVAFALLGYGCGLAGYRRFASTALLALLVAFVFTLIIDIDRPRHGIITVSQDSLLRLQATLERDAK